MRKAAALLALSLLAVCCRKKPAPPLDPADALYQSASGDLSFEIPKDWRALENQGGGQRVSFFGPSSGARPYSVSIGVYFYGPGSSFASIDDYARAQELSARESTPLKAFDLKGRPAREMTVSRLTPSLHDVKPPELRVDRYVFIPAGAGFYVLDYSAPKASENDQAPVFERVLQSLTLRPAK